MKKCAVCEEVHEDKWLVVECLLDDLMIKKAYKQIENLASAKVND